jgi:hypothetical protein
MKHIPAPSEPDRRVVNAATMWHERRNSLDIARALKLKGGEPEALRLLDRAHAEGLLP